MTDTAWDELLDLIDHRVAEAELPDPRFEASVAELLQRAAAEGSIDRELRHPATARWMVGLVGAYATVRARHPEVEDDDDLATLRLLLTRWLKPSRPDRR